jgi:hypothetical protein
LGELYFDLDDTLICYREGVLTEPWLPFWLRWLVGDEPLRAGTPALMKELWGRGWEPWIYTSSPRRPQAVRRWLRLHGVTVAGIINQDDHEEYFQGTSDRWRPTKYPPGFGIDLHVDDSEGVRIEGERHGFVVVVIEPHDQAWAEKVLEAVAKMEQWRASISNASQEGPA